MNSEINTLLYEIEQGKRMIKEASYKLAAKIHEYDGLREALEDGLVKLNFPAPQGFHRMMKNKSR